MKILFNKPPITGLELNYITKAMEGTRLSGDGYFGKKCQAWFEQALGVEKALLTPSCTAALELSAILLDLKPGDEFIVPSYTFVSTVNAFVLRGAVPVYVDIRPDTQNINENLIEEAITKKTKAIVPVHYAGVSCEMDTILEIARNHNLLVVEDAAQGVCSTYKEKALGTIGHLGTYSFHETKNLSSGGEGGLILVNDAQYAERAEIVREKGTNRSQYFRGMVDKYSWVDIGSSFLPSELQAAFLWAQIECSEEITDNRLSAWQTYYDGLYDLSMKGFFDLPVIPEGCAHNGHMFYIKLKNLSTREKLIQYLADNDVLAVFHYVPLHSSLYGKKIGRFVGSDFHTTFTSDCLVRLPLFYKINQLELDRVVSLIAKFFSKNLSPK